MDFFFRRFVFFSFTFFVLHVLPPLLIGAPSAKQAGKPSAPIDFTKAAPVKIIFDTDMSGDCDDAGALGVLHALADKGECEILAVMVSTNSTRDPYSASTVAAINSYYGRPNIPIGIVKEEGVPRPTNRYTQGIAEEFPHSAKSNEALPDAVHLYCAILEKQPNQSVIIVTVGFLTNIKNLLQAPAEKGRLKGRDLVKQKVKTWVCMGGNFLGHPPMDNLELGNVNFTFDAPAAYYAIHNWPGEVVFAGREVGSVPSGLAIGESLAETPRHNPVRMAYELYFDGKLKNRHVADLVTVLYAVRGLRDYWDIQSKGYLDLRPDMTFVWKFDQDRKQSYLLKKQRDGKHNDRYVESVLDNLLVQAPRQ